VMLVVLAALALLNVRGVRDANRFNAVMTVAKLAPLLLVIAVGLTQLHADRLSVTMPPTNALARGSVFLMFAFLGIESALVPSGEVKDPSRTVPRAIAIAVATVVVVYLAVQVVTQSALGSALGDTKTPVADAAGALTGAWGRTLILVGSTVSMFGYVSGMTLAVPRILYAFGRDGFLPRKLADVHERYRTPSVAIGVQTILTVLLAISGTFERLAIIANGAILLVYAGCALAVFALRRRDVRLAAEPFVPPLGGVIPALALIAIVWLLASLTMNEWLAILLGVVVAASALKHSTGPRARLQHG